MHNPSEILAMLANPKLPSNEKNLTHHLLIATPNIDGGIFEKSLVYICRHDNQGVLGLIINKPNPFTNTAKLLEDLNVAVTSHKLYKSRPLMSGPLNPEVGFVLHTGQAVWSSSFMVSENICLTTSRDILHSIGSGHGVAHFELCLGHASWRKGQLQAELDNGDWLVCPADYPLLFNTDYDKRWQQACDIVGVNFDIFTSEIGRA